jgi:hypothetical protein
VEIEREFNGMIIESTIEKSNKKAPPVRKRLFL